MDVPDEQFAEYEVFNPVAKSVKDDTWGFHSSSLTIFCFFVGFFLFGGVFKTDNLVNKLYKSAR